MLAGAEAEAGVESDDGLAGLGFDFGPAWFDDEVGTDGDELEIFFPGFGPVFTADGSDLDFGGSGVEAELLEVGKSGLNFSGVGAEFRGCGADVGGNGGKVSFGVRIDARRDGENAFEERGDRFFALVRSGDGNL